MTTSFTLSGGNIKRDIQEFRLFEHFSTELSFIDGCLLRGSRVTVPPTLHSLLLCKLHDTHPGINRMKSLARSYVCWPGIKKEIKYMVAQCQIYQENRSNCYSSLGMPKIPMDLCPCGSCWSFHESLFSAPG